LGRGPNEQEKTAKIAYSLFAHEFLIESRKGSYALQAARWLEGAHSVKCERDKVSKFVTDETNRERVNRKGETVIVKVPARQVYQCLNPECGYRFSTTTGTLFNDTHLLLKKWL
jgi:hypothetical protein